MYSAKKRLAVLDESFKGSVLVAGDIHGDLEAFLSLKKVFQKEKDAVLVFLGDYADRGDSGLEVIEGVQELLARHPERVVALKGNHEDYRKGKPYFSPWTLGWEVEEKLGKTWDEFYPEFEREFLSKLFLAFLIPGVALCVHGGVFSKLTRSDLESPTKEAEEALLWSDPWELPEEAPNPRGAGVLFGPDCSAKVVRELGVMAIIRGHEPQKAWNGPFSEHEGRVITLSCTGVYGGRPCLLKISLGEEMTTHDLVKNVVFLDL